MPDDWVTYYLRMDIVWLAYGSVSPTYFMFSSRFMLFPTFTIFFRKHLFSFHFAFYAIFNITNKIWKYWKVPLHLLVKWEVVSSNGRYGFLFQHEVKWKVVFPDSRQWESISNISSIPLFWFLIPSVGGGVNFWNCWREISGDRVALFHTQLIRYSPTLYCDTAINALAVSYTFTKVCQRIISELNLWVTYL